MNKAQIIGNLGKDPENPHPSIGWQGLQLKRGYERDVEGQGHGRAQGKDRMASGRDLQ
jgi:hypothetical protein